MSHYIQYYEEQAGGGSGVRNVHAGVSSQRGRGVEGWLRGLFRRILPYIASGSKTVGKEAVRASLNVLDNVANNGANFAEAVQLRESGKNLKERPLINCLL